MQPAPSVTLATPNARARGYRPENTRFTHLTRARPPPNLTVPVSSCAGLHGEKGGKIERPFIPLARSFQLRVLPCFACLSWVGAFILNAWGTYTERGGRPMGISAAVVQTHTHLLELKDQGREARAAAVLRLWLNGRSPTTQRAYKGDVAAWSLWLGMHPHAAVADLLDATGGQAHAVAQAYRASMVEDDLSPATINRRLASLRSLVTQARRLGLVTWALEVESVRSQSYRDTRGPGGDGYRRLVAVLEAEGDTPRVRRDRALLAMMYAMGLRRGEVVGLDVDHIEVDRGRAWILGKGRTEREAVTIPPNTAARIAAWIEARGSAPGPLFVSLDRRAGGGRLRKNSVTRLVRRLGKRAGVKVTPHGLRHLAITTALDRSQGDTRRVRHFSRHKSTQTVELYDDQRQDVAGEIARLVDVDA